MLVTEVIRKRGTEQQWHQSLFVTRGNDAVLCFDRLMDGISVNVRVNGRDSFLVNTEEFPHLFIEKYMLQYPYWNMIFFRKII